MQFFRADIDSYIILIILLLSWIFGTKKKQKSVKKLGVEQKAPRPKSPEIINIFKELRDEFQSLQAEQRQAAVLETDPIVTKPKEGDYREVPSDDGPCSLSRAALRQEPDISGMGTGSHPERISVDEIAKKFEKRRQNLTKLDDSAQSIRKPSKVSRIGNLLQDRSQLRNAILLREIIGPPRAMNKQIR